MSSLGGIYQSDGQAVEERMLAALGDALQRRAPDGGVELRLENVGLVYRAFHTTKEAVLENQPVLSAEGVALCWDGRLDNRKELMSILDDELREECTDAEIVLQAYRRWGKAFLSRLVGDFAVSLWSPLDRSILLARDPVGPRPLFYCPEADRFMWSSELAPLLDLAVTEVKIDDEYIAGYLTHSLQPELTPYKNIHAVPPGYVVILKDGRIQQERFWELDPNQQIRYRTDAEYEEHFRYLFREAVRCRMRSDRPVWATLSGGLDSSAIVCMAHDILQSGEAETPRLETVSYLYDLSTSSDELEFVRSVEETRGQHGHHLIENNHPPLASFPEPTQIDFPDFLDCFHSRHQALCDAMSRDGARVLLTGHGGDEIFCSGARPSPELGDLLVQGRLMSLHQTLKSWSRSLKKPYLKLLWDDAMLPIFPRGKLLKWQNKPNLQLPRWLNEEFVARMRLRERNFYIPDVFRFDLPSGRDQSIGFLSAVSVVSRGSYRSRGCIEVSHPCLHRPLVEFMQAIPFQQRVRPGETRSLLRRSLRHLLPEKIFKRKTKRGPDEAFLRALIREWPRLEAMFSDARVESSGYMNAGGLIDALEKARHGCMQSPLIPTISLELWLRAFEQRSSVARKRGNGSGPVNEITLPLPSTRSVVNNVCPSAVPGVAVHHGG